MRSATTGLGTLLRQLTAALDGGVQQLYDEMGVDFRPRFYPVAKALLQWDGIGVSALAAPIGASQPAVSQTLREMEHAGLISWSKATDKRVRLAKLTPEGRRICESLEPVWQAAAVAVGQIEEEISAELSAALLRALTALDRKSFNARLKERMR